MSFRNIFQNKVNLLYPFFSDNIFSYRFFLSLFSSSSDIFSFGHYGTKPFPSLFFVLGAINTTKRKNKKKLIAKF